MNVDLLGEILSYRNITDDRDIFHNCIKAFRLTKRESDKILVHWLKCSKEVITKENGTKKYYKNGKLHRVSGPAIEHANGSKSRWINGVQML